MRQQLMMQKLLQTVLSDEANRKYYDDNIQEFALPFPQLTTELIIAKIENRAVIDAIQQKATAEGISLVDAYTSLKDVAPVLFAGVPSPMPLNNISSGMRKAIKNLKEGEISEPFHLSPGMVHRYAVAKPIKFDIYRPFDDVKGQAKTLLYQKFLEELGEKYNVVYYDEKLDYKLGD